MSAIFQARRQRFPQDRFSDITEQLIVDQTMHPIRLGEAFRITDFVLATTPTELIRDADIKSAVALAK
jgi:hypothetical protein